MSSLRLLLLVTLAFVFTWSAQAWAQEERQYTLGSGDKIRVTVYGQTDLSGEFQVDGNGRVSLPLVGNLQLGGRTIAEAEQVVVDALKPDYLKRPRVAIQVLNYRPFYILGEVKTPGSYPYVSGLTVMEAIALGGGYTYRARKDDVYIVRGDDPERREAKAKEDTVVLPGDVIKVPERFF